MTYIQPNPNGSATSANSAPVVIASDQATVPVSLASVPSHAVTNAGTFAVQATGADGANVTLGAKADAKNAATDTTAVSAMSVLKQISASVQAPPSQAVTNTGTFAVQATGTVTANAGTNLNTSALALDATLTGGTQQSKITDGTTVATVKAASTAAGATDKALVVAISPNNTVPVSLATNTPTLQSGSTTAVTQATGTNLHTVVDSGTVTAVTAITNALPAGTNLLGKVGIDQTTPGTTNLVALAANQSVNNAQVNGVAVSVGNGVSGTGVQRVTLASDSTGTLAGVTTVSTVTNLSQLGGTAVAMNTGVRSAGTQRVTIATDDVVPASQSGTWTVQPGNTANTTPWLVQDSPATSGGLTYSTNSIKATATSVKASAGQVYGWYIYNSNSSAVYVQFFNTLAGSVTLGTTPPVYSLGIPATAGANVMIPHGIVHSTAIVIAATTTVSGLTAPTNNVDINVFYK